MLAATALMVLAANVCFAATAGSSLISKKQEAAIRLVHPQASRGGRLNSAPRNTAARAATAADTQKAGAAAAAVPMRNTSIVGATTAAVPGVLAVPAAAAAPTALRAPVFRIAPPPVAAVHDAVISGTNVKHSLSTLASVGGAATGKGTAVVNGTSCGQRSIELRLRGIPSAACDWLWLARLSQLGRRMSDFRVFCVEKASQYNER